MPRSFSGLWLGHSFKKKPVIPDQRKVAWKYRSLRGRSVTVKMREYPGAQLQCDLQILHGEAGPRVQRAGFWTQFTMARGPGPQTWAYSLLASCPWQFWQDRAQRDQQNVILLRQVLFQKCPHADKTLMSGLLASLLVSFSTPQAPPLHHSLSSVLELLPVILPSGREEHILDPVPTLLLMCGSIHLQATL